MVDPLDIRAMKFARAEFERRGFDISRVAITSNRGMIHVTGIIPLPQAMADDTYKHEMEVIKQVLRVKTSTKQVILETHRL